ncbi:MAG: ABC transporter ATP-binding protein [Anaerolineae bacterium]|jgi:ATP-binding cassette subfamily B multidrug efflux pump
MAERNRSGASAPAGMTKVPPRRGPGGPGGPGAWGRPVEKPRNAWGALRRLGVYLGAQRLLLLAILILVAAGAALSAAGPYLQGLVIDRYVLTGDLVGLTRIALIMLLVYGSSALVQYGTSWLMAGISQRTVRDLRRDLFDKLQLLPLRYYDAHPHGEIMSRLTNDVDTISMVLSMGLTQLINAALTLTIVTVTMLVLNWRMALVSLVTLPLTALLTRFVTRRTRVGFQEQQAALGVLNGVIEETVTALPVIKSMAQEDAAIAQFNEANAALRKAATTAQSYSSLMGPMSNLIGNIGLAVVVGAGGFLTLAGYATVGAIASFVSYARQFGRPINMIANLYNNVQSALAGAERVFQIMDQEPEPEDAPDAPALGAVRGDVVFDHVDFSYVPGVPVLRDVSFHARPGETVALVGPTGAGKTTVVNLLTRFYDVDGGAIRVDDKDIREVRRDSLRQALGLVLQDTVLFADTILENIRYGDLNASDEEVMAAARVSNADAFIQQLPDGYQTKLQEGGANLSQGQRQLLAIARVVLADPHILILDEATSSIDTRTELHIQGALLKLLAGRTAFVIAHRLSTIRTADQVLVVNHGEIIERGTHESLLAMEDGFYHNLYMSQFRMGLGMEQMEEAVQADAEAEARSAGALETRPRETETAPTPLAEGERPGA